MSSKRKLRQAAIERLVKISNVLLMSLAFMAVWFYAYEGEPYIRFYEKGNLAIFAMYALLYFGYGRTYEAFQLRFMRVYESLYSQMLALLLTDTVAYLFIWFMAHGHKSPLSMLVCFLLQCAAAAVWSYLAHAWYSRKYPPVDVMIIYNRQKGQECLIKDYGYDDRFHVLGSWQVEEALKDMEALQAAKVVFLVDLRSHERNKILKYCVEHDIAAYIQPGIGDLLMAGAKPVHLFHLPMLRVARYAPEPEYVIGKRIFDFTSASLLLLCISPLFLLTALAVKLYDGGPVFYRQTRLTQNGRTFQVLKFRSMRVDAEKDGIARLSSGDNDDRITAVGRFIRKCRLDELPQLINIIKGDMSVVGPRPERPEIAEQYEKKLPTFHLRLQGKAGLTGYAQVYGKYNTRPYDKLSMDLMYLANPSFMADLRIIFATIKILFLPESTEGVAEGETLAGSELGSRTNE